MKNKHSCKSNYQLKFDIWSAGYNGGIEAVLEFLKEVKSIDFEKEFKAWSNCDSYINWKGKTISKCDNNLTRSKK